MASRVNNVLDVVKRAYGDSTTRKATSIPAVTDVAIDERNITNNEAIVNTGIGLTNLATAYADALMELRNSVVSVSEDGPLRSKEVDDIEASFGHNTSGGGVTDASFGHNVSSGRTTDASFGKNVKNSKEGSDSKKTVLKDGTGVGGTKGIKTTKRLEVSKKPPYKKSVKLPSDPTNPFSKSISNTFKNRSGIDATMNSAVPDIDYIAVRNDGARGTSDLFYARIVFTIPSDVMRVAKVRTFRVFRMKVPGLTGFMRSPKALSLRAIEKIRKEDQSISRKNNLLPTAVADRLAKDGIRSVVGTTVRRDEVTNEWYGSKKVDDATDSMMSRQSTIDKDNDPSLSEELERASKKSTGTGVDKAKKSTGTGVDKAKKSTGTGVDKVGVSKSTATDVNKTGTNKSTATDVTKSYLESSTVSELDKSVATDEKTLKGMIDDGMATRKTVDVMKRYGSSDISAESATRMNNDQINDVNATLGKNDNIVRNTGASGFDEIISMPIGAIKTRTYSGLTEFFVDDPTVEFGCSYKYYVVSVNERMEESPRSRIVDVYVNVLKVPVPPSNLTYSIDPRRITISVMHDDSDVEKVEVYRRRRYVDENAFRAITTVSSLDGFVIDNDVRKAVASGFIQVGEAYVSQAGVATFVDDLVTWESTYEYRVYAVDMYGNKSATAAMKTLYAGDGTGLVRPTLVVEKDADSKSVKVTVSSDDPSIVAFFLSRRDETIRERAFTIPTQPSQINFETNDPFGHADELGPVLTTDELAWNGYIENTGGSIVMYDRSVSYDHTYKYKVYGVDTRGQKTPIVISKNVFVSNRPMIRPPIGFRYTRLANHIKLEWESGNINVMPEERIGSVEDLEDSINRTLFQLERREVGAQDWLVFPLTEKNEQLDPIGQIREMADFELPPLSVDSTYYYRILEFQSGAYISNYSHVLEVDTSVPILVPINFQLLHSDSRTRPFYISLNWDTDPRSGEVGSWTIERAVVNNYAAATMNFSNRSSVESMLKFEHFTDVFRESSRFRSRDIDEFDSILGIKSLMFPGQHHYIDLDVAFGNTYFYRLTAFGVNGVNRSPSVIRGMRLEYSSFNRKIGSTISSKEKEELTMTRRRFTPIKRFDGNDKIVSRGSEYDRLKDDENAFKTVGTSGGERDGSRVTPFRKNPNSDDTTNDFAGRDALGGGSEASDGIFGYGDSGAGTTGSDSIGSVERVDDTTVAKSYEEPVYRRIR